MPVLCSDIPVFHDYWRFCYHFNPLDLDHLLLKLNGILRSSSRSQSLHRDTAADFLKNIIHGQDVQI